MQSPDKNKASARACANMIITRRRNPSSYTVLEGFKEKNQGRGGTRLHKSAKTSEATAHALA